MLLIHLYLRVGILLTRGKRLNDHPISLRWEGWTHKTGLLGQLFKEVPKQNHENDRSFIYVLVGIDLVSISTIFHKLHKHFLYY